MGGRFQKEKEVMKCVVCKKGETKVGTATVTLEKDGTTLAFKGVPADVCRNCGEEYVDGKITAQRRKGSHVMLTKPGYQYTLSVPQHRELGISLTLD